MFRTIKFFTFLQPISQSRDYTDICTCQPFKNFELWPAVHQDRFICWPPSFPGDPQGVQRRQPQRSAWAVQSWELRLLLQAGCCCLPHRWQPARTFCGLPSWYPQRRSESERCWWLGVQVVVHVRQLCVQSVPATSSFFWSLHAILRAHLNVALESSYLGVNTKS